VIQAQVSYDAFLFSIENWLKICNDKIMIEKKTISEVVHRLVTVYQPLEIYLFGSYAWGKPTDDSDLDLLVVVEESNQKRYERPVAGLLSLFGLNISKDLIVSTNEEFSKSLKDKSSLYFKIKQQGKRLYAKL
jgi:predicted nucleotidyltransferase